MLIQQTAYVNICVYSRRWSGQGMVMKGWYKHCKQSYNKQQNQYCRLTAVWCCKIEKCWGAEQWSMETNFNTLTFHTVSLYCCLYSGEHLQKRFTGFHFWRMVKQALLLGMWWDTYPTRHETEFTRTRRDKTSFFFILNDETYREK